MTYVPSGDEVDVARRAESYRRLRQARAELMKLSSETAELADALQEALAEPFPASVAGARKRGRGKKDGGGKP